MTRTDIINHFMDTRKYQTYLEIGIYNGDNFRNIRCPLREGVDPTPLYDGDFYKGERIYKVTSDMHFEGLEMGRDVDGYDLVFIDGLHTEEQVERDIHNSLKYLNKGGVVVLHDCNPPTEVHARTTYTNEIPEWNGTVYKAWIKFRALHGFETYTIDTDWGVGIIDQPLTPPITCPIHGLPSDWKDFDKNRKYYLNLISPEEFLKKINESRPVHNGL